MFFYERFILYIYLMSAVNGGTTNVNCPRFCNCDSYLQLNRAQCSSRNLIAAEVDVPNQVQILDLSYNDITIVDNTCFANFLYMKYLNLSHNALHVIHWDAFVRLRQLSEIDLSYNRLEYLDERLFARNIHLNRINLEGNKLETWPSKPFLSNSVVSELNLRNAHINLLLPQVFSQLKNLKRLDLSGNLLNNFNLEDFQHLANLQELNLNENFIKCNDDIRNKLHLLKNMGIEVAMDDCVSEANLKLKQNQKMFERMTLQEQKPSKGDPYVSSESSQWKLNLDLEEISEEEYYDDNFQVQNHEASLKQTNEWLRLSKDSELCSKQNFVLCQDYRSCLQKLNKSWHEKLNDKVQDSLSDKKFAFVLGMAIGASAIVLILACALCIKRVLETKKSEPLSLITNDFGAQPLARPVSQLPLHVRRHTHRRTPRSLVRYEGPVAENFLSRLFGRPARQQYYRTINQNTATLIRRLSQSNLFSNRLSQHFVERQSNCEEIPNPPPTPLPTAPRSETPPPSYRDIVTRGLSDAK